jgi:hypothetical protein
MVISKRRLEEMIREVILQNFRADIAERALAWVARSEDCDQALMACLKNLRRRARNVGSRRRLLLGP